MELGSTFPTGRAPVRIVVETKAKTTLDSFGCKWIGRPLARSLVKGEED